MALIIPSVETCALGPPHINYYMTESRRNQEQGGELESHEEVSPEEIKSREVELG